MRTLGYITAVTMAAAGDPRAAGGHVSAGRATVPEDQEDVTRDYQAPAMTPIPCARRSRCFRRHREDDGVTGDLSR